MLKVVMYKVVTVGDVKSRDNKTWRILLYAAAGPQRCLIPRGNGRLFSLVLSLVVAQYTEHHYPHV